MEPGARRLSPAEAKTFYDRFGRKQDWQLYERKALEDLIGHGRFGEGHAVFELGCGTGRLAARLLEKELPESGRYVGQDISDTMVEVSRDRLRRWADRVEVHRADGTRGLLGESHGYDRFVCTYVLDLLTEEVIAKVVDEARRLLEPDGLLCTASLTHGVGPLSRAFSRAWSFVADRKPGWVGGCRPVRIREFVTDEAWSVHHHRVLRSFGLCSEVLVAQPGPGA